MQRFQQPLLVSLPMNGLSAQSLEVGPLDGPRVLLFHGLTGVPAELGSLAVGLVQAGYRVEVPLLPGHGTTPEALLDVEFEDVLGAALQAIRRRREPFAIGGMSMGALVALCASADVRPSAVFLLSPPAVMTKKARLFDALGRVPWGRFPSLVVPKGEPAPGEAVQATPNDPVARAAASFDVTADISGRYSRIPLRWAHQLRRGRAMARMAAARVRLPVFIAHGASDRTASQASAFEVASWLSGASVSIRLYPGGKHVLTLGASRAAVALDVARFLSERRRGWESA